jgi:hypothetical protein
MQMINTTSPIATANEAEKRHFMPFGSKIPQHMIGPNFWASVEWKWEDLCQEQNAH